MKGTIELKTQNGTVLTIPVEILGERSVYGRTEYLVKPIGGTGQYWTPKVKLIK